MTSVTKSSGDVLNFKGIKKVKYKLSSRKSPTWLSVKRTMTQGNEKMETDVSSSGLSIKAEPKSASPAAQSFAIASSTTGATGLSQADFLSGLLPVITAPQSSGAAVSGSGTTVTQLTFSIQPDQSTSKSNVMTSSTSGMPVKTTNNGKTPTCKVCGDESSGYHYGVDSCEGCKGFFRRCITQGMTHKCSNEEKCEITPFTRNSCQYCRLKKCFAVGMAREASRLGRRPKRLKDTNSESRRETNLPIAPYPSPAELYKLRMAELQRLLQQNGTFKSELMQAFLTVAKVSFSEHQRNNNDNRNQKKEVKKPNKKNGTESGYTSSNSPSFSNTSMSPSSEISNKNNLNAADSKTGIIDENVDNFRIAQEADNMDNNKTSPPTTTQTSTSSLTSSDFTNSADIKTEPGLDNQFAMPDNCGNSNQGGPGGMPGMGMGGGMPDAASPFIMQELSPDTMMMMPDMMQMMEDSSMMESMMSGMMMGGGDMPAMMSNMMSAAEPDPNANEIDVDRIMEEVRQVPSELRQQLIEQVISTVTEAHFATVTPTKERVATATERIDKMRMECGMPDLSKLSINPGHMWQKFVQSMVYEITQVVKFCKKLPGFGEINQEDQIVLIKKGSFELLLCRMCLLVDDVNQEMFDPNMEMKCPRALIKQMPMGQFIDEFFNVASQLNPLQLLDDEVGLFSAALIMCPEREGLGNVQAIEKLNMLFLQSLYMTMRNTHENVDNNFSRLLSLIPVFRDVNRKHSMALNSMKMQKPQVVDNLPELHKEIYDLKEEES